jgi:tripartite-type tricarboxylate transporter receptor subunit TctC
MYYPVLALIVSAALLAAPARAEDYPNKPIQLTIATAVGGAVDIFGRALAEGMGKLLGQPVVATNRDGASNTLGAGYVAQQKPDGYNLGFTAAGPFVSQPYLRTLPFKPTDFDYVCQAFELQIVLAVRPDSPIKDVKDFIAAARATPGGLSIAGTGPASIPHIALSQLEQIENVKFNHVNFRGDGAILPDLLGGHVPIAAMGLGTVGNQPLRLLATFARERLPTHPDLPTMKELGYPLVKRGMIGLFAPKGLEPAVLARLETACKAGVESEAFKTAGAKMNQPAGFMTGKDWMVELAQDARENKEVIERLGLKQE